MDDRGATHSIGKHTTGATAAEVREKLADLDRERMPTVERVREEQKREREQAHEREKVFYATMVVSLFHSHDQHYGNDGAFQKAY